MSTKCKDVAIVGAGPAGTSCALALRNSGLDVVLIDKASFPREKVCGDAIPGPAFRMLESMAAHFGEEIQQVAVKEEIRSSQLYGPNGKMVQIDWKTRAYNADRRLFDQQLLDMVNRHTSTTFLSGIRIKKITKSDVGYQLEVENCASIRAKMVIGCDGAYSVVARQLGGQKPGANGQCAAVRAYFRAVENVQPKTNEFHYITQYLPGYFWIFPVGDGVVNVGFGMLSDVAAKQKINLRKALQDICTRHPSLSARFENAEQLSPIRGFGLPLALEKVKLSGERFLLAGDAGSLIDPLQGHGIDKAMISGQMAADQVIASFQENDFSAAFLKAYDEAVYARFWSSFQKSKSLLKLLATRPWLLNFGIRLAQLNWVKERMLKGMY